MKPLATLALALIFLTGIVQADERSETERLAPKFKARSEVVAWDGSRVDLLSDTYAIEVEWAPKWKESIGQALYYSILFHRKPGIVLLRKKGQDDSRFIYRCQAVCAKAGIAFWVEDAQQP